MPIEISAADVAATEEFLASLAAEQVPDGRFTEGTALRDLTVKALAVILAQVRKENNTVQALQSLKRIREIASSTTEADLDPAVLDAADALMSNWFLRRKGGGFARGAVQVYVARKQDYLVPRTTRIPYDRARAFYPDSATDVVVPAADVQPLVDASGAVLAYYFTLRVVASKIGEAFNVFPATWAGTGGFSPYVLRISNSVRFEGGKEQQTTLQMIDEAPNAAAVRNLINDRSISATLPEQFSYVSRLTSIGYGDLEMSRDVISTIIPGTDLHIGGHFDVYAEMAPAQTVFEGIVGGAYLRPDGVISVFNDTAVTDWGLLGVLAGDVIRITGGVSDAPRDYVVSLVSGAYLYVDESRSFGSAAGNLQYYIYRPLYGSDVQVYPAVSVSTTGASSAIVQTTNRVVLPAEPHYDILDVAIVNPGPDPYVNNADGYVHFTLRSNTTPVLPADPLEALPFQLASRAPKDAQSSRAFDEIILPAGYDGKRVRVTYQTLAGFNAVDAYVRDRYQRVLCANAQVKGYHPIYLSFRIPYTLSPLATTGINELRLRQNLVAYINSFDPRDIIDVSDLTTYLRRVERNVGTVFQFPINYNLVAPDGRLVAYTTSDVVKISEDRLAPGGTAVTNADLLRQGVSDRTVRYLTRLDLVHLEAR